MSYDAKKEESQERSTHALIFELEYVAAKTRAVEFASLKSAAKTKGVDLSPIQFSRSLMSPLHRAAVTDVLKRAGKKTDAIEKAVTEVDKTVANYCENEAELDAGLAKLIKATKKRGIPVVTFSALPRSCCQEVDGQVGTRHHGC